jgi:hypothetical protein
LKITYKEDGLIAKHMIIKFKTLGRQLIVMGHTYNPSTPEAEAGGWRPT